MDIRTLEEKLKSVVNVQEFIEELRNIKDEDEFEKIMKKYNLDIDVKEIMFLLDDSEELDLTDLEDVVGGCKCKGILIKLAHGLAKFLAKRVGFEWTCVS